MKGQIVFDFERWYAEEFDVGSGATGEYGSTILAATNLTPNGVAEDLADDEAEAYLRAKRNVDTLHRAKKIERMRPGGYKK